MSFQEFCVQEDDVTRRAIINPQVRTLYSDAICGSPDTDFANPQLLETAIEHLKTFSFVTLTEKLNDDLPLISHLTKTKMKSRGPRRNVAKPGENQISREEARQILGDRVALDQKLYEAAKDIRNEKIATYLKK